MFCPEFPFIPLLGLYRRVFLVAYLFILVFLMPATLSRYIFLLVLGLYDSPLPPFVPVSCLVPSQYISLGPDYPGLLVLPGRLLIFFCLLVSSFLFLVSCFCGAQKGQKTISLGWDCSIYDIMSLVLCSFLRSCVLVDVYTYSGYATF
jgi:hypothetical protein